MTLFLCRECDCRTCSLAGGPCVIQTKDSNDKTCCSKCAFYEKLDRDYLDFIKKEVNRRTDAAGKDRSLPVLGAAAIEEDLDSESEEWATKHTYHLSWAVFKHLSSK